MRANRLVTRAFLAPLSLVGLVGLVALLAAAPLGCSHSDSPTYAPPAQLVDPTTCQTCHGDHYNEWSGSMHAYATDDPIFVSMQKRAQRETNGQIGSFCVQCHAPVAFRLGTIKDGTNLDAIPPAQKGVTCYFCHQVSAVDGDHNNPLVLANDSTMRAGITDPVSNTVHASSYSVLHDRAQNTSAQLCGSCHDVTNQANVAIETTFAEWKGTIFSHQNTEQQLTCQACHMPGADGMAANLPGVPTRRVHDHSMPGVDVALTDFPNVAAQTALVQQNLDPTLVTKLCVNPPQAGDTVSVTLDDAFAGHAFPSGASHDRRAWIEVIGYSNNQVIYQSGVVPDGQPVSVATDPSVWLLDETLTDAQGQPTFFMWQATSKTSTFLPPTVTNVSTDPAYFHSVTTSYPVPANADKVTARLRIIPFGLEVLQSLVASGDLDASYLAKIPVFALAGTTLTWTTANGFGCVP